ncbi:hypothetical protein MTO96_012576 [Rhipicephalus appendiculatus]
MSESRANWPVLEGDSNPLICLVSLKHKIIETTAQLAIATCDSTLMTENFGGTENALQLDGKDMSADQIQATLTQAFGDSLGSIGAGLLCCSLAYMALTDALASIQFSGDCKIKVGPDTNISLPSDYMDGYSSCNNIIIEVGEANEADIKRLTPVLKFATYILYAPTPMSTLALAKLRTALLPNNFQALPGSVCQMAGLLYDRPSMSYYRKGSELISLDTNKTIVKKV